LDLPHAGARQSKAPRPYEELPPVIRDIAWKAQLRLCARYRRLAAAGKAKVVVTTAIAREMIGFIWAIPASLSRNSRDEQSLNAIRDRTHQRCAPPATGPTVGNPRRLL
jgi:hypothetical protein